MKVSVGTKILIRCGGRMLSTRILMFSPSGAHVLLGASPIDEDCLYIGWRPISDISIVEVLERPAPPEKQETVVNMSHR